MLDPVRQYTTRLLAALEDVPPDQRHHAFEIMAPLFNWAADAHDPDGEGDVFIPHLPIADVVVMSSYGDLPSPGYIHEQDAGFDLRTTDDVTIAPGEVAFIRTGLRIRVPEYTFGAIHSRSGLATKRKLRVANGTGVVDAGYTGEWIVALENFGPEPQTITRGERVAQAVITPVVQATMNFVDDLPESDRGAGGFASTGEH